MCHMHVVAYLHGSARHSHQGVDGHALRVLRQRRQLHLGKTCISASPISSSRDAQGPAGLLQSCSTVSSISVQTAMSNCALDSCHSVSTWWMRPTRSFSPSPRPMMPPAHTLNPASRTAASVASRSCGGVGFSLSNAIAGNPDQEWNTLSITQELLYHSLADQQDLQLILAVGCQIATEGCGNCWKRLQAGD